ncbi:MAG: hypothetical protein FJ014_16695 [Chloroflexi bacterium]|nr:hypothetical protein [Chloroflexota bacterium]
MIDLLRQYPPPMRWFDALDEEVTECSNLKSSAMVRSSIAYLQTKGLARGEPRGEAFAFVLYEEGESGSQQNPDGLLSHVQQGRGPQAQDEGAQGSQGDGYSQGPA